MQKWQKELTDLLGNKVRFDFTERLVYSHDMGILPDAVRKTIQPLPDAVVQPESWEEISSILAIANRYRLPVVPRGSASSGYGGPVPAKGGLSLDLVRMNRILQIDTQSQTVTVEPGVIWEQLNNTLANQGLTLKLYPTSAPSATVGGWLAQGGTGIGSYAHGHVDSCVQSLKVLLPHGQIVTAGPTEIWKYIGLEGTTGIIVEATIKVDPLEEKKPLAFSFTNQHSLFQTITTLADHELGIWSLSIATPEFNQLIVEATNQPKSNPAYTMLVVLSGSGNEKAVTTIVTNNGGQALPREVADHGWQERFYPMRLKRKGPSVIPAEAILPITKAAAFFDTVDHQFGGRFAFEGTMVGKDQITILGFLLADERSIAFPLAYIASLAVMETARKLGGQYFTTGMYFNDQAENILGSTELQQLWRYKQEVDPRGVLNPGKVFPSSLDKGAPTKLLHTAMRAALMGKSVFSRIGVALAGSGKNKRQDLPEEIAAEAFICAQCGYCRSNCTVFSSEPWESNSPRGKYYLLHEYLKGNIDFDVSVADRLFACTTCKSCDQVCQANIPIVDNWLALRPIMQQKGLENTGLNFVRNNVLEHGNFWGVNNQQRTQWLPPEVTVLNQAKVAYWPGCWASLVTNNVPNNLVRILDKADIPFTYLGEEETCCGLYLAAGGYYEDLIEKVRKNYLSFKKRGVETLILSCPGCFATFHEFYPLFVEQMGLTWNIEVKHATVYLNELLQAGKLPLKNKVPQVATFHDSCHLGRWAGIYDEPRNLIQAVPGVELREMAHNKENGLCCGLVCAFNSFDIVGAAGTKRVTEAVDTGANTLVTACAGCNAQFTATAQALGAHLQVRDFTDLLIQGMGLKTIDATANINNFMAAAVEALQDSKTEQKKVG